jgi:hypothetical protein
MEHEWGTPPARPETAGSVEEYEGDVDAEPADSSLTVLDPGGDVGPDQGGTPGDASGESGDPGSAAR